MKMNIVDLLAALPDRSTTEKLVSDYFDSQEPSLSIEPSSVVRKQEAHALSQSSSMALLSETR